MKSRISAIIVVCAVAPFVTAHARPLGFEPAITIDFETLSQDVPISELGWTGNAENFVARNAGEGNDSMAVRVADTERRIAWSPAQTPVFKGGTLYFSTWMRVSESPISGARILIVSTTEGGSSDTGKLGGYGIMDTPTMAGEDRKKHRFAFYDPDKGGWLYSTLTATPDVWYEIVLVVETDANAPEKSSGSLYYRAVGEPEFTEVPEFHDYPMTWYVNGHSASEFSHWRIENARNGVQLDNFSAGSIRP